ncbi:MAG: indolepyruvate oxidoreductase subunit beta [Desulfobacteraceae bacterium]|nr:indolepyruvate oxidoreductase subunit beta [Desulfobacteraceae bacterium]
MGKADISLRIFFTGVGGQGTLLATRLVGEAALEENIPVLMSEIHGMAQRGGVVESSVVLGEASSPTISDGEANIVIAFEPVEAARALPKCNPKTILITGTTPVLPFTVTTGQATYPAPGALYETIALHVARLIRVDADALAAEANAKRSANVVMIGVLAGTGLLPVSQESWKGALARILPSKLVEANLRAFDAGYRFGLQSKGKPLH